LVCLPIRFFQNDRLVIVRPIIREEGLQHPAMHHSSFIIQTCVPDPLPTGY
jgi:hypothetical protein